jgi:tetratricopeptide (TPR) repeat protein
VKFVVDRKLNLSEANNSLNEIQNNPNKKNLLVNIAIISILIGSNFYVWNYLYPDVDKTLWFGDDALHISVANSFRMNKTFDVSFWHFTDPFLGSMEQEIKQHPTIENSSGSWGPLYYVLLGSFYQLMGTQPPDFQFHASVFNFLLTSIFIGLFFLLIRSKFNLKITFLSSLLVVLSPFNGWIASHALLEPLMLIFSVSALFFLDKSKTHYFFYGVFAGLSHLSHPIGILVGITYAVFLLVNREFKGFLITIASWNLVIIPWMIRNYYLFKDFGWGLYLPFSSTISKFIAGVNHTEILKNPYTAHHIILSSIKPFDIFVNFFNGPPNDLTQEFHMDYVVILIFALGGFAFFNWANIKKSKLTYLIVPIFGILYVLTYYLGNGYEQLILAFFLPILIIYFLYKKRRSLFVEKIPRFYRFVILYGFVSIIAVYYVTLYSGSVTSSKQIMFAIFLLIPISLVPLENIIKKLQLRMERRIKQEKILLTNESVQGPITKNKVFFLKIAMFSIMVLVVSPILISYENGIQNLNNLYFIPRFPRENNETRMLDSWLATNAPPQSHVASDYAPAVFLRTGLPSIALPYSDNQTALAEFLDYYDVSYVALFNFPYWSNQNALNNMNELNNTEFIFHKVYSNGNSIAMSVVDLIKTSDISKPTLYFQKGLFEEATGKTTPAEKIYKEISSTKMTDIGLEEKLCNSFIQYQKYDYALQKCTQLLDQNKTNDIAMHNLVLAYLEKEQKENVANLLSDYEDYVLKGKYRYLNSWNDLMDFVVSRDNYYVSNLENSQREKINEISAAEINLITKANSNNESNTQNNLMNYVLSSDTYYDKNILYLFNKAYGLEDAGNIDGAIQIYKIALNIDQYAPDALHALVRLYVKIQQYDNAIQLYDNLISNYENKHQTPDVQKTLMETLYGKATLAENLGRDDDAENAYQEIIRINMFDTNAHEQLAHLLEKEGLTVQAQKEYDFVKRLEATQK